MKKITSMMLAGLCSMAIMAQNEHAKQVTVPAAVKSAFAKDFATAKTARWGMEDGNYEAEFKLNGTEESATYDKTGHRLEVEVEIKTGELPAAAMEYVKTHYADYKLSEAAKITNDKNVVTYEAEISKGGKEWDVIFDASGKFLRKNDGD